MKTPYALPHHSEFRHDTDLVRRAALCVVACHLSASLRTSVRGRCVSDTFTLSNNTELLRKEITNNRWRNMLPCS